jgi:hypothetical protein
MELGRSRACNRKRTGEKLQEVFVDEIELGETVRERERERERERNVLK